METKRLPQPKVDMKAVANAMNVNAVLMCLSGLKQMLNLRGLKMPDMSCTHYYNFGGMVRSDLEWFDNCNFLPLFYTGVTTNKKELDYYKHWSLNMSDHIEGFADRYPITEGTAPDYLAAILTNKALVTPHVILDYRKSVSNDRMVQDREVLMGLLRAITTQQGQLLTFGDKWDLETCHNPMITVLVHGTNVIHIQGYEQVHSQIVTTDFEGADPQSIQAITYVRNYTN